MAKLKDPSLRQLASKLQSSAVASKAAGTPDACRSAFLRWRNFARSKDEINRISSQNGTCRSLPPTSHGHCPFPYCSRLGYLCHSVGPWPSGIPSPTDSPIVYGLRQIAKRLSGARVVNKKEPISADMIKSLVNRSNLENLLDLRNLCIFFVSLYRIFF